MTADPSLLVPKVPPTQPVPPPVIGPFDENNSVGDGSVGYTIGGIGWYRKHFAPQPGATGGERHVELRFDGVYQNADVWVNGVHLGFHPYGYTPFAFDITPYLNRTEPNVLAVRVDNSGKTSRWYSGSGIYRHTWLTVTGPVRIPLWGVYVTTPTVGDQQSMAHIEVSVANLGANPVPARVRIVILDPHGRSVAAQIAPVQGIGAGATAVISFDIPIAHPKPWSPDSPALYTARADVLAGGGVVDSGFVDSGVVDSAETAFGIRSLEWNGSQGFLLNGKQVKMVGGCVHDTHGPLGAVGLDRTEERRVEILKAAGFNAVRTAHNPPTPALLDAADRLGMLVMDEFTDVWDTGKNPQDYSVYFPQWWRQDLTSMILRDRNHPSIVIWSLGNEIVEDGQYAQRGQQMAALLRSLDQTRPITVGGGSTFGPDDPSWQYVDVGDVHYNANGAGYGAIHAAHPDKAMTQSESFPATIFQDASYTDANAWAVGNWVWAAWDYLGEAGIGKTPIPPAGTAEQIGNQWIKPTDWATATFTVPYAPGELTAIASKNGTEIGRRTLTTAGFPAALRLTPDVRTLTTSRDALAHVLVAVTDRRGHVVTDATVPATFQVSGAGELAGVANGNPHNVDSFRRPHRYTWHGQALAILRPAKRPGAVTLTARAPGVRPATLTLAVRAWRR